MKKTLALGLALVAVLMALTACTKTEPSGAGQSAPSGFAASLKTLADVYAVSADGETQEGYSETKYVYVFQVNGVYYRAVAQLESDVSKELWDIEYGEDQEQKIQALLGPVAVERVENLSEQIPSQEELDKLVGKTGQELFDDGWSYYYYNLEDMETGLYHGPFSYTVCFDYDGEPMENTDDFDFYAEFKDLTVSSVTFSGLGDATNLDE